MPPTSANQLVIELLTKGHNRKVFSCGNTDLDEHLAHHARKNTEYGFGRGYVAVEPGQTRIWGYYTISAIGLDSKRFPSIKGCPSAIAMALMGRLAVDQQMQRMGVGELLMGHMAQMAKEAAEKIGVHAIFVEAKNQKAKDYYLSYEFIPLMDNPLHMWLPLNRIRP